jgi:hypothetical protein
MLALLHPLHQLRMHFQHQLRLLQHLYLLHQCQLLLLCLLRPLQQPGDCSHSLLHQLH